MGLVIGYGRAFCFAFELVSTSSSIVLNFDYINIKLSRFLFDD